MKRAVVAAGHPLVAKAAIYMIKEGGNAFDAAVAAGFASSIAEPALTSLGGGGFLLAKTTQGEIKLYDFFVDAPGKGLQGQALEPNFYPVTVKFPGSDQVFNIGPGSVAVPGNLKGFIHIHQQLGRLPLKKVLEPAINLCENGVELNEHQAYFLSLLEPIMTATDQGKAIFLKNGKYCTKGDVIYNHELASFLKRLPHDLGQNFYQGKIAEQIDRQMRNQGGLLTFQDLSEYEVREREPLKTQFDNLDIITNGYPSFGGGLICLTFELLAQMDFLNRQYKWGQVESVLPLATIFQEIEKFKDQLVTKDSSFRQAWKKQCLERIERVFPRGTTHISICDTEGNVASMTTSNGEGSGYYAPGTGIMLNNMMGEDDLHPEGFHSAKPGTRIGSMMSPTLILRQGTVKLVLGSGGSKRIRTAITQVILNYVAFGLSLKEAVVAPRIHFDGQVFQVEPGYEKKALEALKSLAPINVWKDIDVYFGGVHAVEPLCEGAGDPRRGGSVEFLYI